MCITDSPVFNKMTRVSLGSLWGMGFRPFFLFGSLISILLVGIWVTFYSIGIMPLVPFAAHFWHAHEMVFGFALAIISGFLLTASANWTGTRGLHGQKLIIVFIPWILARIFFLISLFHSSGAHFAAFFDLIFIPVLIVGLAPPLWKAGLIRNLNFLIFLGVMWVGNLIMYLASWKVIDASYMNRGLYLGLNIILVFIVVIGGRVIPFFTRNALQRDFKIHKWPQVMSFVLITSYLISDFIFPNLRYINGAIAGLLGLISLMRLIGWYSSDVWRLPILWILHIGYFWISLGFGFLALSDLTGEFSRSIAIHSLTVGAIGVFVIGMMSRVSLGHSGRPIKLSKLMILSYVLINIAALIRLSGAFLNGQGYMVSVQITGILWVAAFGLFLWEYSSILLSPRLDGREG